MSSSKKLIQAAAGVGGDFYPYTIDNSVKFNDDDSSYLSRTPSTAGNRKTWTWSGWVKRGNIGNTNYYRLFSAGSHYASNQITGISFTTYSPSGLYDSIVINSGVYAVSTAFEFGFADAFRDPSAWYHIVVAMDTTAASDADRCKVWVNNRLLSGRIGYAGRPTTVSQNYDTAVNNTVIHNMGGLTAQYSTDYYDGYLAEVNFIDGQALDPTSFGQDKNGVWIPKSPSVTYGTNGFYLDFGNSSALGTDSSGNSNNYTSSGLTSSDQMIDTPTNNFATLNPLAVINGTMSTFSEGNLKIYTPGSANGGTSYGTIAIPESGKWYFEYQAGNSSTLSCTVGISEYSVTESSFQYLHTNSVSYYNADGAKFVDNVKTAYGSSYVYTDIIGIAVDADADTITFYKNNVSQGSISHATSGLFPACSDGTAGSIYMQMNFGQNSSFSGLKTRQYNTDENGIGDFYYTPPSGYLALCTANLPEPAIGPNSDTLSDENFNTVLWTGDQSARTITGYGFQPDFLWTKCRSTVESHRLHDVVRGGNGTVLYELNSNETSAEGTDTLVSGFATDGFTIAAGGNSPNVTGRTYAGWAWKANGSGVSNTDGSITSTVSANQDAGFSIVKYTGNGTSGATIGHGLGVAPKVIIQKGNADLNWPVWFYDISNGTNSFIQLNLTTGTVTDSTFFTSTAPTSTVFSVGGGTHTNSSSRFSIAYCFAEVEGFSKFGSYTGNGSTDGPFIYTGFRPAWIMIKETSNADDWMITDATVNSDNPAYYQLKANTSGAEVGNTSYSKLDFVSNGFKLRTDPVDGGLNTSGSNYIYMAFAENPFKYSNAR